MEIGHTSGHAVQDMDALSFCAHNRAVKLLVYNKTAADNVTAVTPCLSL